MNTNYQKWDRISIVLPPPPPPHFYSFPFTDTTTITFLLFSSTTAATTFFLNLSFLRFLLSFILYLRFIYGQFKAFPLLKLWINSFQVSFLTGGSMVRTVKSSKKTYEIMKKIRSFPCVFSNKIKCLHNLTQSQSPRSPLLLWLILSLLQEIGLWTPRRHVRDVTIAWYVKFASTSVGPRTMSSPLSPVSFIQELKQPPSATVAKTSFKVWILVVSNFVVLIVVLSRIFLELKSCVHVLHKTWN